MIYILPFFFKVTAVGLQLFNTKFNQRGEPTNYRQTKVKNDQKWKKEVTERKTSLAWFVIS